MPYQRNGIWYTCKRVNGKLIRKALKGCPNRKMAEMVEAKWQNEAFNGVFLETKNEAPILFKDFCKVPEMAGEEGGPYYERHAKYKKNFQRLQRLMILKLTRFFGEIPLHEISFSKVDEYHKRSSEKAPVGANREIALLSNIFNSATLWNNQKLQTEIKWLLPGCNPTLGIKRNQEESRERVYSFEELKKLFANAAHEKVHDMMMISLLTGLREGEIRNISKKDIDFVNNLIVLPNTKSKNLGRIKGNQLAPICSSVRTLLAKYISLPEEKPFDFDCRKAFDNTVRYAGIAHGVFHDLRRSFATYLDSIGVDRYVIKQLLRHSVGKDVTNIYVRTVSQVLHKAVNGLQTLFFTEGVSPVICDQIVQHPQQNRANVA